MFIQGRFVALLLIFLLQFAFVPVPKALAYSNPAAVDLLTVDNFAALAKTAITNLVAGTVLNNGDMGLDSPATCTGFPSPCTGTATDGTINNGVIQYQNAVALQGQTDSTAVVTDLNGRTADETIAGGLLDGLTLNQGVYDVPATSTNLTGDLTLSGDADSVFIFRAASTLVTAGTSRVLLTGGAQACNVFWTVASSATFDGATQFTGTVLASASVDFTAGGATLDGRAIAQTAAVTFRNTTVNNSSCAAATASSSAASSGSSSGDSGSSEQVPGINLTKVPNPLTLPEGPGSVTYTFQVTNTGDLVLSDVTLVDNKCSPATLLSGDRNSDSLLDLDEVWTYRCTKLVSATVTNTATVRALANGTEVSDSATAKVIVGELPPPSSLVPKLPDTGSDPGTMGRISWIIMLPSGMFIALFSFYLARKKRVI